MRAGDGGSHRAGGHGGPRAGRSRWKWALAAAAIAVAGVVAAAGDLQLQRARLEHRLLAMSPDQAATDPALVRVAVAQGRQLFRQHCAACHGADMRGNAAVGAPDLTDRVWLYGAGRAYEIERTLLYGIRSGQSKAHDVTDMPAFGQRGLLTGGQIRNLVQYLLKLDHRPYDAQAAEEGRAVYYGTGGCSDCHGADARGDSDYGAPDLTANVWNNGGDVQSLYDSLYFGRHRIMPGWLGPLNLEQIRALSIYLYTVSHPPAPPGPAAGHAQ